MQQQEQPKLKDLLEFPCDFPYKVVGLAHPELTDRVLAVVQQHAPGDYSPSVKPSRNGKYHSVSFTINAQNIEQIERLYKELAEIELVKMVL